MTQLISELDGEEEIYEEEEIDEDEEINWEEAVNRGYFLPEEVEVILSTFPENANGFYSWLPTLFNLGGLSFVNNNFGTLDWDEEVKRAAEIVFEQVRSEIGASRPRDPSQFPFSALDFFKTTIFASISDAEFQYTPSIVFDFVDFTRKSVFEGYNQIKNYDLNFIHPNQIDRAVSRSMRGAQSYYDRYLTDNGIKRNFKITVQYTSDMPHGTGIYFSYNNTIYTGSYHYPDVGTIFHELTHGYSHLTTPHDEGASELQKIEMILKIHFQNFDENTRTQRLREFAIIGLTYPYETLVMIEFKNLVGNKAWFNMIARRDFSGIYEKIGEDGWREFVDIATRNRAAELNRLNTFPLMLPRGYYLESLEFIEEKGGKPIYIDEFLNGDYQVDLKMLPEESRRSMVRARREYKLLELALILNPGFKVTRVFIDLFNLEGLIAGIENGFRDREVNEIFQLIINKYRNMSNDDLQGLSPHFLLHQEW